MDLLTACRPTEIPRPAASMPQLKPCRLPGPLWAVLTGGLPYVLAFYCYIIMLECKSRLDIVKYVINDKAVCI